MADGPSIPRGIALPLNSKRLTVSQLRLIAKALKLPTAASTDEVHQLVEGKLGEMGKEPRNVQVFVCEEDARIMALQDEDGVIVTTEAVVAEMEERDSSTDEETMDTRGTEEEGPHPPEDVAALKSKIEELTREKVRLETELSEEKKAHDEERKAHDEERKAYDEEKAHLEENLRQEKQKRKQIWRLNCQQIVECDELVAEKDKEIETLKAELKKAEECSHDGASDVQLVVSRTTVMVPRSHTRVPVSPGRSSGDDGGSEGSVSKRRGKAPPLDFFTGEWDDTTLDDWLPGLQRVADHEWNKWTEDEILLQLAGYLQGRALQEWNLMGADDRKSYKVAVRSLRDRLGYGSRILAAQDFRHTSQKSGEPVSDFIRRLERSFTVAYGKDDMSDETRSTLLYGQLQEGLRYDIMKSPGVSGAQSYRELCIAARNEEKRQVELKKKQTYNSRSTSTGPSPCTHAS